MTKAVDSQARDTRVARDDSAATPAPAPGAVAADPPPGRGLPSSYGRAWDRGDPAPTDSSAGHKP